VALRRHAEAVPLLEGALAMREQAAIAPADLAATRFALAQALHATRRDPARVRLLATQARDVYARGGRAGEAAAREVAGGLAPVGDR
jgi:hypothetical protein